MRPDWTDLVGLVEVFLHNRQVCQLKKKANKDIHETGNNSRIITGSCKIFCTSGSLIARCNVSSSVSLALSEYFPLTAFFNSLCISAEFFLSTSFSDACSPAVMASSYRFMAVSTLHFRMYPLGFSGSLQYETSRLKTKSAESYEVVLTP